MLISTKLPQYKIYNIYLFDTYKNIIHKTMNDDHDVMEIIYLKDIPNASLNGLKDFLLNSGVIHDKIPIWRWKREEMVRNILAKNK